MNKLVFLLLTLLIGACTALPEKEPIPEAEATKTAAVRLTAKSDEQDQAPSDPAHTTQIFPGTGQFVNPQPSAAPAAQPTKPRGATTSGAGVTLNFEEASIRDVVKVIFDTLKENYTIDAQVQGDITVQTSRPLTQEQLLPTLETLLRATNAVLVHEGGIYKIIPAAGAVKRSNAVPRLKGSGVGYGVRIVPLHYVSAVEMQTIITPLVPDGSILLVDASRNLIMLSGTPQELNSAQETIDTFDVNWLKGMSIGLFRLRNVDSQAVANELNQLLGEGSKTPISGLVRLVALTKLNAVIVISQQKEYLKEVAVWIERLDGSGGARLYTYHVQNSRAEYVAELLNSLFNLGGGSSTGRGTEVAPGLKPAQLSGTDKTSTTINSSNSSIGGGGLGGQLGNKPAQNPTSGSKGSLGSGDPSAGMEEVRIVADTENNALLIWATSQNYERILSTLGKMDVSPRQVLIEATFVEVTLTGQLKYGVQWFFNHNIGSTHDGNGSLGLPPNAELSKVLSQVAANQFSYAITNSGEMVRALITALAADSKVKVLSSPQVMVMDNQQASIQVGTSTPIPQGTSTVNSVTTSGGVTYKETGVLLEVTPRVNAGGMVSMEITQKVSEPGAIVELGASGSNVASAREFLERGVNSKVVVKDGNTLVLGGLIRETGTDGKSGIPVLYQLPVVGALFGQNSQEETRTELIVLITPRVVENSSEASELTKEIQRKMQAIHSML